MDTWLRRKERLINTDVRTKLEILSTNEKLVEDKHLDITLRLNEGPERKSYAGNLKIIILTRANYTVVTKYVLWKPFYNVKVAHICYSLTNSIRYG